MNLAGLTAAIVMAGLWPFGGGEIHCDASARAARSYMVASAKRAWLR